MAVVIRMLEEVVPAVEAIAEQVAAHGFTENDVYGVRVALHEAIVNAITHGNRGDPVKKVEIRCECRDEMVVVEVEDEGRGFHPDAVPDPRAHENLGRPAGRGLLLMRHYATSLRFNDAGNCVTFCKRRGTTPRMTGLKTVSPN